MRLEIIKKFFYMGRNCFVVKIDNSIIRDKIKDIHIDDWYCGYIEMSLNPFKNEFKSDYGKYNLSTEITYQGDLSHFPKNHNWFYKLISFLIRRTYIGFDTAHYYNKENPETNTADVVEKKCKDIVNELNVR